MLCCQYFPRQFVEPEIVDTRSQVTRVRSNDEFRLTQSGLAESAAQSVIEDRFEWLPSVSRELGDAFGNIVVKG